MELQFLGGAQTVTGSKYLVTTGRGRLLIDCGLFQGHRELRLRNWAPFPVPAHELNAIILTHAHIDHTGFLPRLVREGYSNPVYATRGTADLSRLMLPDSGRLQEEDARYANKTGFSSHQPALPLYTEKDARAALSLLRAAPFDKEIDFLPGAKIKFIPAGHILGSRFAARSRRTRRSTKPPALTS